MRAKWFGFLLGALAGLGFFAWRCELGVVVPTNIDWAFHGDGAQHVLGWLMFRDAPWGLPLGRLDTVAYPMGTNIGFTDSLPLAALALKPLSGLLPLDFQYVGMWLLLCYVLQGAVGALLTSLWTPRPLLQALGGALFASSPTLGKRLNHDTLCAHFLILAMLWLYLDQTRPAKQRLTGSLWLCALASAIHPYLTFMVFVLALALLAQVWLQGQLDRAGARRWAGAIVACVASLALLLGYASSGVHPGGWGFGKYSSNLLAFIDPFQYSRLLPSVGHAKAQYEGYAYLGLGVIVLAVLAAGLTLRSGKRLDRAQQIFLAPLAVALAGLTLLAWSSAWYLGPYELFSIELGRYVGALFKPFRGSGRFIWPLYYAVVAAALWAVLGWARERPTWVGPAVLVAALAIQLADVRFERLGATRARAAWYAPEWEQLSPLAKGREHLAFLPPAFEGVGGECDMGLHFGKDTVAAAMYFAYAHRMTTNSAYLARVSPRAVAAHCAETDAAVAARRFRADTLYVLDDSIVRRHGPLPELSCRPLLSYQACVVAGEASKPAQR